MIRPFLKRRLAARNTKHATPTVGLRRQFQSSTPRQATVKLYNSLTGSIQTITNSVDESKGIACYSCGPTTYAPAHLGHARTYVCLDILRRCLEYSARSSGLPAPLFVMNITDVDDKILNAAGNDDPITFARKYEADFWKDLDALNCLRPHVVTRVTEYVESHIIPYIQQLVDKGMAYEIKGRGVYFNVDAFETTCSCTRYGKLMPAGSAAATDFSRILLENDQKINARDFALWKLAKDGESLSWSSPWGLGRCGWHIECSAMIQAVQDQFQESHTFVLHTGGVDLKFPHHTNEIAQAEAYHHSGNQLEGKEWIQHWVHVSIAAALLGFTMDYFCGHSVIIVIL
jgi:cysteinyl-tRNA synthetase